MATLIRKRLTTTETTRWQLSPTIEEEEHVGASEKNKVTEKCLIFEKLIKENDSQELVKRINKATHEVKKVTRQGREQGCQGGLKEPHAGDLQPHEQGLGQVSQEGPEDQGQFLHEGKGRYPTEEQKT